MSHSVYDERGNLLQSMDSEILAFAFALTRQKQGKLVTMLLSSGAEVVFPPHTVGTRAESAVEYRARAAAEAKEEMEKPPGRMLSLDYWRK